MGLFKKISDYFNSADSVDQAGYWVYLRCNKCDELLRVRINLNNDLSIIYDDPRGLIYFTRKTIVGNRGCFQRIGIELTFNHKRKLIDRQISGGDFIERDEFLVGESNQSKG